MGALSAAQYTMHAQPSHVCGGPGICVFVCVCVSLSSLYQPQANTGHRHVPQLKDGQVVCVCVCVELRRI